MRHCEGVAMGRCETAGSAGRAIDLRRFGIGYGGATGDVLLKRNLMAGGEEEGGGRLGKKKMDGMIKMKDGKR